MSRLPALLIVNTNLPVFPGQGGVEALTTRQLAGLCERVGLVSMVHSRADLDKATALFEAGVEPYLWQSPAVSAAAAARPAPPSRPSLRARLAPWLQRAVDRLRAGRERPADTFVLDRGLKNLSAGLWRAHCEGEWPIVSVVESTAAAFLDALPRPRLSVLVMHDVRALVYERQAAAASGWLERLRLRREARRYRAFEARYCREYDLVTAVSEHDARFIAQRYRPRRVVAVPLPVDASYFAPSPPERERPGRIVLTGQMNHPPNADAAAFFARDVLPLVRAWVPEAHFQIVGRHPGPEVEALASLPGVEVTGEVPDVRPYLAEAAVVVVPLRFGSGARQKILEAWCLRKCVVSTPLGAEGLDARHGETLMLAEGAAGLAAEVSRLLRDAALRDRVRDGGRAAALERHDPVRVVAGYAAALQSAYAEAGRDTALRAVVDARGLASAGEAERTAAHDLLRGLGAALGPEECLTVLLPATLRAAWSDLRATRLRVVSEDDLSARVAALRSRAWQAVRGALGIFRDDSPELRRLRRLRRLDARVALTLGGTIAPDLLPLRHVLMVAPGQEPDTASLSRARALIVTSDAEGVPLLEGARPGPERVSVLEAAPQAERPASLLAILRQAQHVTPQAGC